MYMVQFTVLFFLIVLGQFLCYYRAFKRGTDAVALGCCNMGGEGGDGTRGAGERERDSAVDYICIDPLLSVFRKCNFLLISFCPGSVAVS